MKHAKTIQFFEGKPCEVFRAGDYGPKGSYSEADLDEIVSTFNSGNNGVVSHLTVDHDAKSIGGVPGPWGKVEKVWRDGKALFASFSNIPAAFRDWFKERPYIRPSIELYRNGEKAVGLRNIAVVTSQPEVKGLAPMPAFHDDHGDFVAIHFEENSMDDKSGQDRILECDCWPMGWGDNGTKDLRHFHSVLVDKAGNGITSEPMRSDDGIITLEKQGHTHAVAAYEIQEAGDTPHKHGLFVRTGPTFKEGENKEEPKMPEPTKKDETKVPETTAKPVEKPAATFSEADVQAAAKKAADEAAEKARSEETAKFAEKEKASSDRIAALELKDRKNTFESAKASLLAQGVPPVALNKPGLFEFYNELATGPTVVSFGEAKKPAGEYLLSLFDDLKGFVPVDKRTVVPPVEIPRNEDDPEAKLSARFSEERKKNPDEDPDATYSRVYAEVTGQK